MCMYDHFHTLHFLKSIYLKHDKICCLLVFANVCKLAYNYLLYCSDISENV